MSAGERRGQPYLILDCLRKRKEKSILNIEMAQVTTRTTYHISMGTSSGMEESRGEEQDVHLGHSWNRAPLDLGEPIFQNTLRELIRRSGGLSVLHVGVCFTCQSLTYIP